MLFQRCFELVFVFKSVSFQLLLPLKTLFVPLSAFFFHLFLMLQLLLVPLEFKLHLIFCPSLSHLCLVLHSLPPLLFCNLRSLNFKFSKEKRLIFMLTLTFCFLPFPVDECFPFSSQALKPLFYCQNYRDILQLGLLL